MKHGRLINNFNAGGAITARSIVKFGTDEKTVVQAAAATDDLLGVTTDIAAASGEPVDVCLDGIMPLKAGGSITRGKFVTSDASGNAVQASAAAGSNVRVIGVAMSDAASGDIFDVLVEPGSFQG